MNRGGGGFRGGAGFEFPDVPVLSVFCALIGCTRNSLWVWSHCSSSHCLSLPLSVIASLSLSASYSSSYPCKCARELVFHSFTFANHAWFLLCLPSHLQGHELEAVAATDVFALIKVCACCFCCCPSMGGLPPDAASPLCHVLLVAVFWARLRLPCPLRLLKANDGCILAW